MSRKLRMPERRHVTKLNNSGSAMVMVIIAIAFIGILASVLMYTSMLNYQMKVNNLRAKDNFYSAESVLDEIRMGMQGDVSDSIREAYSLVLTNFSSSTAEDKQYRMRYYFLSELQKRYKVGTNVGQYDLCKIYDYVVNTAEGTVLATKDSTGAEHRITRNAEGKYVDEYGNEVAAGSVAGVMTLYADGLSLRDLKVIYTDANNYVSIIETDLRIQLPDMEFAQSVALPSLTGFSLVAQNNIVTAPENLSINTIRGSFYGKRLIVGKEPDPENPLANTAVDVILRLEEAAVSSNSDKRMVIAEDIYLGQGAKLTADSYGELWADSISMHGGMNGADAEIRFKGTDVYVAGDLEILGDDNVFEVGARQGDGSYSGRYVGFGNGSESKESSAILINGTNTDLRFEELTELTLAGNAYIGLSKTDSKITAADGVSNAGSGLGEDVLMGQSVAVKSDQIAYLIPSECLGIERNTGKSVFAYPTNPMTLEDYKNYIQGKTDDVIEVSSDISCDALGGKKLSDYGIVTDGAAPMFQKYFKRVNSEITLVYYYVMFDKTSETALEAANRYFADYYRANKDTMEAYTSLYTKGIRLRDASDGFYTLHLAGNMVSRDANSVKLQDATLSYDTTNMGYRNELVADRYKFKALSKKMIDVYELLTPSETLEVSNVYNNLVRQEAVYGYWTAVNADSTVDNEVAKYFGNTNEKAVVVKGDYIYTGSGTDNFTGLIIATGDVTVKHSFRGTVLSGGTITLSRDVTVEPNEEAVLRALTYVNTANGLEYHVTDFLLGGDGYLRDTGKTYQNSDINIGDLIVYENWEKQ